MIIGKPVYLTPEGLEKLKVELDDLVNVKRLALAKRLHFAIKQGDLSENADYISAKEEQGFLEGRILEVTAAIRDAVIIAASCSNDGRIVLGCHVTVVEEGYDDEEVYHLVGATEANPAKGKISNESPLGQSLLGRTIGDVVTVHAPAGEIQFRVVKVG